MRKITIRSGLVLAVIFSVYFTISPVQAASPFAGKILLAVEGHGEAWYINPADDKKYYLGRPADAFQIMRSLAIGISNTDFSLLEKGQLAPAKIQRLSGRILLKPQDKGKAYYFEPSKLKLYYLGRPTDAFQIMKETALGAANEHIDPIPAGTIKITAAAPVISPSAKVWRWSWNNQPYLIQLELSAKLYNYYQQQTKVFSYSGGNLPSNWRDQYYGQFLNNASQDNIIRQITEQLQQQAKTNQLTADQTAELTAAFIQSIPYDQERSDLIQQPNNRATPNYPYETLYLNKGVCTDKALLAWLIFRKLGYGVALMSYPEANHMSLGLACPQTAANYSNGYCYLETTQFYHIGLLPNSINGQASSSIGSTILPSWQPSGNLAEPLIYQVTPGKNYTGLTELKSLLEQIAEQTIISSRLHQEIDQSQITLGNQEAALQQQQQQLNQLRTDNKINEYNQLVPIYNQAVQAYEQARQQHNQKINQLNQSAVQYNQALSKLQPSHNHD
ncbi:hypothetical protein EOM71_01605 [Candidatus Falkowbacteria bacterium]|jgi:hypothetical protein|nr:hypothetical protein [Candidatus Falkowbacteria bacterium]